MKFRFERTQYGWSCYAKQGAAYQYFGHFLTQREAKERFAFEGRCLKFLATQQRLNGGSP